jgi:predicted patatin/cPLA2 family phospholipase
MKGFNMKSNYGLVLEGGGFRGCYTAGALKWLSDNNIYIKYSASISATTAYAFCYAAERIEEMKYVSTVGIKDKEVIGIRPLLKEGGLMGMGYLQEKYFKSFYKEALEYLRQTDREVEIGLFNMDREVLEYYGKNDFDERGDYIKASCVLPLAGKMTEINGQRFLDGGIRTMISIERSLQTGHDKNLVIITKDEGYVRKPNGFILDKILKLVYRKFPTMLANIDNRVDSFYHELGLVQDLEKQGKALLIRPSRDCGVTRLSGTYEQLEDLFNLGYQDMEDRRADLYKFFEIE